MRQAIDEEVHIIGSLHIVIPRQQGVGRRLIKGVFRIKEARILAARPAGCMHGISFVAVRMLLVHCFEGLFLEFDGGTTCVERAKKYRVKSYHDIDIHVVTETCLCF